MTHISCKKVDGLICLVISEEVRQTIREALASYSDNMREDPELDNKRIFAEDIYQSLDIDKIPT